MHYLVYIFCIAVLCSCGGKRVKHAETTTKVSQAQPAEMKVVNSLKFLSPTKDSLYRFGDDLVVEFECKKRFPLDSSVIYIDGKEMKRLGQAERQAVFPLGERKVGTISVKVIAWHPEGKQGVASTTIRVKPAQAPVKCTYEVVKEYAHDPKAYTQGLIYQDGFMYEGTGQFGESSIRKIDMSDGDVLSVLNIDSQLFGEGITIWGNKIYQITWRSRKGFVYDLATFSLESSFEYNSEGWGITTVNNELIMSDGTNKLYHIAPSTFNILGETEVYDNNGPVPQLNELEYVDGLVWANVWLTDRIVAIDPSTGVVKYELDLSGILSPAERAKLDDQDDVLNGIAWNPEKRTFYVTGKRWPKMFEIKVRMD